MGASSGRLSFLYAQTSPGTKNHLVPSVGSADVEKPRLANFQPTGLDAGAPVSDCYWKPLSLGQVFHVALLVRAE